MKLPIFGNKNDILLSYPRSGNTFVRYFLETIFDRPTWGNASLIQNDKQWAFDGIPLDRPLKDVQIVKLNDDGLENSYQSIRNLPLKYLQKKPFFKIHNNLTIDLFNKSDKLLLLVRDPYECLLREYSYETTLTADNFFQNELEIFFQNLELFDNWSGKKEIVYFENMVEKPSKFFNKVFEFYFDEMPMMKTMYQRRVNNFLNNLPAHRQRGKQIYIGHGAKINANEDIHFHKNNNDSDDKNLYFKINQIIKKNDRYNNLLKKYFINRKDA